jgi:hypothetical protein
VPLVALVAVACGRDEPAKPSVEPGTPCTSQATCGSLLCFEGRCVIALPAAPSCAAAGAAPALVAGAAVVATDPGAGVCTHAVMEPDLPAGSVQDLGEHTVGEVIPFQVPAGTWSLTFYEQEVGDSAPASVLYLGTVVANGAVPDDVKTPLGTPLFDDTPAPPADADGYADYTGFPSVYLLPTPSTGVATFPNAPKGLELARVAGALPAGTWTLMVNDWAYECYLLPGSDCTGGSTASRYRVHVATKGPPASTGALDVHVYLATSSVGGDPVTAAQAAADPGMARLFQGVATVLGRAGLCLGTVTFHDLPAWARARFGTTDYAYDPTQPCDEVHQLFQLSTASSGRSVSLFLVDVLRDENTPPGQTLAGVDGSIPGPSGLAGTTASGAVMIAEPVPGCSGAFAPRTCAADELALVASHELGHWLGLYHPTEAYGSSFDPLGDTPRCPCKRCGTQAERARCEDPTSPTQMLPGTCNGSGTCAGASNLMFWAYDVAVSTASLTPQQGEVVRLNPAVRQEASP